MIIYLQDTQDEETEEEWESSASWPSQPITGHTFTSGSLLCLATQQELVLKSFCHQHEIKQKNPY